MPDIREPLSLANTAPTIEKYAKSESRVYRKACYKSISLERARKLPHCLYLPFAVPLVTRSAGLEPATF
jgi:hypothetical protein